MISTLWRGGVSLFVPVLIYTSVSATPIPIGVDESAVVGDFIISGWQVSGTPIAINESKDFIIWGKTGAFASDLPDPAKSQTTSGYSSAIAAAACTRYRWPL